MRLVRVLVMAALLSSPAAFAQQMQFHLDPMRSHVEFTLGDVLHTVHGSFQLKSGELLVDTATGAASGAVVLDAASGNTGNSDRDRKMHQDILDSAKYPEIRFTVQGEHGAIPASGSSEIQLSGVMAIHGGGHPITVTAPVQVNSGQAIADVHFVVPYVQWGMKDPSTFVLRVSKQVDIVVHAVGSLQPAPKP